MRKTEAKAKSDESNWGLERALARKQRVIEPEPNEVQIDIDSPIQYAFYRKQRSILDKAGVTKGWRTRVSKSKTSGHMHITISLPDPTHVDIFASVCARTLVSDTQTGRALRVGLAAILCDDPHRAAFNWCRVVKGNKYPIAFFEKEK